MSPHQVGTVQLWQAYTRERNEFRVTTAGTSIFLHGKFTRAQLILTNPTRWTADPAIGVYEEAIKHNRSLTLDQMKALAISLKQYTPEIDPHAGGPNKIPVFPNRHNH